MMRLRLISYFTILCVTALTLHAQQPGDDASPDAAATDSIRVSLVTFMPGSEIYELYGHTELRVTWQGNDYYFNYGVFDFEAPNFTARFVAGETDYMCVAVPARYAKVGMEGRKMVEQDLNLTRQEAETLRDALIINQMPANRTYRYRCFSDNCSSHPRDMVERAINGRITYAPLAAGTIRDLLSYYNRNYAWNMLGIDLALGSEIDRPVTDRQAMFVPMLLMDAVAGATVERDGVEAPLVSLTRAMVDGSDDGTVLPPTPWYIHPVTVLMALLAIVIVVAVRDVRRGRNTRWLDAMLLTVLGLLGCLLCFLVFVSTHEATSPNWNLLWLNPLHLVAAVAALCRPGRWTRGVMWLGAAMPVIALLAWPLLPQAGNLAFLPIGAVAVVTCLKHARRS